MSRKVKGIRKHGAGFQTYCRVNGEFRSETWDLGTSRREMTAWLREQRAEKTPEPVRVSRGTFDADAVEYLKKIKAMPSYSDREHDILLWAELFSGRRRRSLTAGEIREARDRWLNDGYAASTVNHRLRALSNLWTVLDGRRKPNPVREVPEADEPEGEPRAVPFWVIRRILAAVPELGHGKKGERRPPTSKTKACLGLMAWAGLTHSEIRRLERHHWDDVAATLYVTGRKKGKSGGASRIVPLNREARASMAAFDTADAWGGVERSVIYQVFRRACETVAAQDDITDSVKAVLVQLRPYDLRHSHATALYRASGDAHAAAAILGHRSTKTTQRYIKAAVAERMHLASKAFEVLVAPSGRTPRRKAPVAQGREHRSSKPGAAGSIPARRTIRQRKEDR